MFYNMSKPLLAGVEGKVTDSSGNTVNGADVTLHYGKDNKVVGTMITDIQGRYAFSKLVPGEYILNATVTNTTTMNYDYVFEQTVTLVENETLSYNITLNYALIIVSGHTKYNTNNIANLTIDFIPDKSILNNTAKQATAISDASGLYTISLQPGTYNTSIDQTVNESGQNVIYSLYIGDLVVKKGQDSISNNDLILQRKLQQ